MKYRYRLKGLVKNAFIIRGVHFCVGDSIDFCVYENELEFVKSRCEKCDLIDLSEKVVEPPKPVLKETQIKNKIEGVKNGLQSNRASKSKNKVSV